MLEIYILPLAFYFATLILAYKYQTRWLCAIFLIILDSAFVGFFLLITMIGGGVWQDVFWLLFPMWSYVLLVALAAIVRNVVFVDLLMVMAHVLLGHSAYNWRMKPEVVWLGCLFVALLPIWFGIRKSKPRPGASTSTK
jgi:hypothetical protein